MSRKKKSKSKLKQRTIKCSWNYAIDLMCGPLATWLGVQLACKEQDMHSLLFYFIKLIHDSSCTTCVCKIT